MGQLPIPAVYKHDFGLIYIFIFPYLSKHLSNTDIIENLIIVLSYLMYIKLGGVKKRINQPLTVWLKNEFFKSLILLTNQTL